VPIRTQAHTHTNPQTFKQEKLRTNCKKKNLSENEVVCDFDLFYNDGHDGICFRRRRKHKNRRMGSQL